MRNLEAVSNDVLDHLFAEAANSEDHTSMEAIAKESSRRARAAREEHERAWNREVDEAIAGARITVMLTRRQAEILSDLLPADECGLDVLATRVKGSRDAIEDAIGFLGPDAEDEALDVWESGVFDDLTDAQRTFGERQVIKAVRGLRARMKRAIRPR